jgi:hypothetical protein
MKRNPPAFFENIDAGARHVIVRLHDNVFEFKHDRHDFTEEEFASLCRACLV